MEGGIMSDPNPQNPGSGDSNQKKKSLTRRKFLSYAGILGATPLVQNLKQLQKIQQKIIPKTQLRIPQTGLMISALRPDDLLYLDFEFINLKLVNLPTPRLIRENRGQPAYMIVHFPPQSIAEEAFYEASTPAQSETPKPPPVFTRISRANPPEFLNP
jgi:hypothetical protein